MKFSWHPTEDTRKVIIALVLGALVSVATQMVDDPHFHWTWHLLGTVMLESFKHVDWSTVIGTAILVGGAGRATLALPEPPTVPAKEVQTLKPIASNESADKVAVAQAADYPPPGKL